MLTGGSSQRVPGVEVFFFPDENVSVSQLCREAMDVSPPALETSDPDSEEFVMVEHEAGSGILVCL